jgi:hypothetical protein
MGRGGDGREASVDLEALEGAESMQKYARV